MQRIVLLAALFACSCTDLLGKLGEDVPQLTRRFGAGYSVEGAEETNNLTYKFRSKDYAVDVLLARSSDKLVSTVEAYYSEKALQPDGEPPAAVVRGIMDVTAPKARWLDAKPTGLQRAAFVTADGTCEAAVLPPATWVRPKATFTLVVSKLKVPAPNGLPPNDTGTAPAASEAPASKAGITVLEGQPPTPTPIFRIHINGSFVQVLAGKTRKEIQATLGWPVYDSGSAYVYEAKVPAFWSEADGQLIIHFVKGKARAFQVASKSPFGSKFVSLSLQNAPEARFEPVYQASNLTGSNWRDAQNGFVAATTQSNENEYLLTIDLTPRSDRNFSPFARPAKAP